MKTRARLILEKRFRQWATGKTLAAVSAAALLGLALSSQPAIAQDCLNAEAGYGGVVRVRVNGVLAEGGTLCSAVDPATGFLLLDSHGKEYIDLSTGGSFGDGTYFDDTGASITIARIPRRVDPPRVFLDKGNGGVSLMVATDMLISADTGPAVLTLELDSQDSFGIVPGGIHTYGVTMDGSVLGPNPGAQVAVTGAALNAASGSDVVNTIPPPATEGDPSDQGPSLAAGTTTVPLKPGGLFTGAVVEDINCGATGGIDVGFPCRLQVMNSIEISFSKQFETVYTAGSFGVAAVEAEGPGRGADLLKITGVPFDTFNAAVATQSLRNTFEVGAVFKLGPLSGGINPATAGPDDVFSLDVGDFSTSVPLKQFKTLTFFGHKFYTFEGLITGRPFKAVITPLFGKTFGLAAAGFGANLTDTTTFVDVTIGADKGAGQAKVVKIPR